MANLVYQVDEGAIAWSDSGSTHAMTLNNLATASGRQGAEHTFGASARPRRFNWIAWVQFETNAVVDQQVEVYFKTGDGTHYDNDDGTGDIAVSNINKLKNLELIGVITVDEALLDIEMSISGEIEISSLRGMPVMWVAGDDNLRADANTSGFQLTPVPDQIQ